MMREKGSDHLSLHGDRLDLFRDRILLRDPRGSSRRPSIVLRNDGSLEARGPFLLVQDYRVEKDAAIQFLAVTRDDNPIHVVEDIVPGAMTLSKVLLPLEVLLAPFSLAHVRAKFTGASFYGQRTVNHFFFEPGPEPGSATVAVNTYQAGRIIAKVEARGSVDAGECAPETPLKAPQVNVDCLRRFCASLALSPDLYVAGERLRCASFPRAYLASLPSGEMVRQLKGKGGMLNVLSLDFGSPAFPVTAETFPEVSLEKGRDGPRMFNRVLTKIWDGLRTYGRGFALVHRGATP